MTKSNYRSIVVSLIGRPNVGKSSLFNRIMRRGQQAITHDLPGVTRDRHYGIAHINSDYTIPDQDIIVVDTGGFYPEPTAIDANEQDNIKAFFNIMADHGRVAIRESDLILLVVDIREGLNPFDTMIVDFIRKERKDFILVVNKYDSTKQEGDETVFYELGINSDQLFMTSAEHGHGLDAMKCYIQKFAHEFQGAYDKDQLYLQRGVTPRHDVVGSLAIVGSPNAGKSTLLNALVGSNRALVSDIAGTTVDPIEAYINLDFEDEVDLLASRDDSFRKLDERLAAEYEEFKKSLENDSGEEFTQEAEEVVEPFSLTEQMDQLEMSDDEVDGDPEELQTNSWRTLKIVDTAGIRKSGKVEGYLENQSVYSALKSITESDVVLFVVDALKGITHQDRRLIDIALEKGKSLIVCLNKIDLMNDIMQDSKKKENWLQDMRDEIAWLSFCELVPISAMKKTFFKRLKKSIVNTLLIRHKKVATGPLNRCLSEMVERHPVAFKGTNGQRFKIKYASMLKATPPTFILFCNKSQGVPDTYRRYLQNGLRTEFNLMNTPVHLIFRSGADLEKRAKGTTGAKKGKPTK